MASITQRAGKYRALVRRCGITASKTFTKRKDAETWAKKTESEIERNVFLDVSTAQQTTLAELLSLWYVNKGQYLKSAPSLSANLRAIKQAIGALSLHKITKQVLTGYRDNALKKRSPQTVKHELSLINRAINTADDFGIVLPPISKCAMPKLPPGRNQRISKEIELALSELLTGEAKLAFKLALQTAMRRGEIANLEWRHIDLKNHTLHIPITKTGLPRTIPLTPNAISIFSAQNTQERNKVFSITGQTMSKAFQKTCRRLGLSNLRFHDLRHEATSRFFEIGLNVMEVASITGHKDLKMLQRYTHLNPQLLAEKLARLEHINQNG